MNIIDSSPYILENGFERHKRITRFHTCLPSVNIKNIISSQSMLNFSSIYILKTLEMDFLNDLLEFIVCTACKKVNETGQ